MPGASKLMIIFLLSICLILSSCVKSPESGSPTPSEPASSPAPSPSSDYFPPPAPTPPQPDQPSDTPVDNWSSFQWLPTGGLGVRRQSRIDFTDAAGNATHSFIPNLASWPDAPEEQIWGESFCAYAYSEKYVLAWFHFYGNPPIMQQYDSPTPVDMAILDMQGNLVHAFPRSFERGITALGDNAGFESSLSRRTLFYWLTNDLVAINTGAQIWFYNLPLDELRLAADYRSEVYEGYALMESHGYGITEGAAWVKDAALYYVLGHGYSTDAEHNPISSLWKVSWDEPPVCLTATDTFTSFDMPNGHPFALLNDTYIAQDGSRMPACRIWYVNEQEAQLDFVGISNTYGTLAARQNAVGWISYEGTDLPYLHVLQTITCYDLVSGEQTIFSPRVDNGGFPPGMRLIDMFDLLEVSRTDMGFLIYYYFIDVVNERRSPEDFVIYLACHNTANGSTSFNQLHSAQLYAQPGSGPALVLLAVAQDSRELALLPLPSSESVSP